MKHVASRNAIIIAAIGLICLLALAMMLKPWGSQDGNGTLLRVGLYQNEPKLYADASGQARGLFAELLQAMAERENWQLEWVQCQWLECLELLAGSELDLMPDVAYSELRDQGFDFHSVPVSQAWGQIYTDQLDNIPRTLAELTGLRIAILRGAIQENALDTLLTENGIDYTQVPVDTQEQAFIAVREGAADAAVAGNYYGSRHGPRFNLVETPIAFNQVSLYYATAEGRNAALLETIDGYLREWRADSQSLYYQLVRQALASSVESTVPLWLMGAMAAAVLCVLLLLLFIYSLRWKVRQHTAELEQVNYRLQHVLDSSPVIIYSMRAGDNTPLWVSGNIERILGFTPQEALTPGWWEAHLHHEDYDEAVYMTERIRDQHHLRFEYRLMDARGRVRFIRDEMEFIPGGLESGGDEVIGSLTDVTASYEQEERVSYLTNFDHLTSLPNRSQLSRQLASVIREIVEDETGQLAVVFADLDRFKNVNESLGNLMGDRVLLECARRIRNFAGAEDLVARLGADEFSICMKHREREDLDQSLQNLLYTISEPINIEGQKIVITASLGVCSYPQHGRNSEELMNMAEQAMYAAKSRGGNAFYFYHAQLQENTFQRFQLENDLRLAISNKELELYYQPQVSMSDGSLVGLEALVRWNHPQLGLISPAQFIPIAEDTGIIFELDNWVLNAACRQLRAWDRQGLQVPVVSVNVTAAEIESEALLENVRIALHNAKLAPERLELEITESMLMHAPEQAIPLLTSISRLGVGIAMDDFGTGYSNLSYLGSLPLDRLKLDRSFVADIGKVGHNESIIKTIFVMAQALELQIIAEGVEEEEQAAFLKEQGCQIGQGYLYARPEPADKIYPLLRHLTGIEITRPGTRPSQRN